MRKELFYLIEDLFKESRSRIIHNGETLKASIEN